MSRKRVLLVGGGLTSAMVARLLRDAALAGEIELHAWDRRDTIGGRASVEHCEQTGGTAEMGLQYVTEVDGVSGEHRELYDALERAGLLVPMHATIDGARNADGDGPKWVAPSGFDAVTKALFDASGAHLALGRAVSAIERVTTSHADGHSSTTWRVSSAGLSGGGDEQFDAVVLTMPVPHVLALGGAVAEALLARPELLEGLRGVQYSSRYALALFYAPDDERAAAFFAQLPWTCKYVPKEEDDAVVFLSKCAAKRDASEPPSLVVHSSVPFALSKLKESVDPDDATAELLARVRALLPGLPEPVETRTTLWRLSQVRAPLESAHAAHTLADGDAPLILAGDALSKHGSRFDGCFESAHAAASALRTGLGLRAPRGPGDAAALGA
ncbi:hypothetical protein KFE25_011197 [Diacronema lutheri]|uniref:Amine oxidase domain-containing protein n=1 Tax=Diacronema lutheri TaxID=2081491 RepID=A0A8J5XHK1_DIALT|nr:hypothetical protein KFE25_011197 [Diacronema lutheri]